MSVSHDSSRSVVRVKQKSGNGFPKVHNNVYSVYAHLLTPHPEEMGSHVVGQLSLDKLSQHMSMEE